MNDQQPDLVERRLKWFRNHPAWSTIIFVVVIIVGLETALSSFTKLYDMASDIWLPEGDTSVEISELSEPIPLAAHDKINLSFEDYYKTFHSLTDRFRQQLDFVKEHANRRVEWDVHVCSVSRSHDTVSLKFCYEPSCSKCGLSVAWFTEDFGERLFSLQKSDLVHIEGVLKETSGMPIGVVHGDKLTFLSEPKE